MFRPKWSPNMSITCSAVEAQQAVIDETQVRFLPIARCSSIAVTEESTPPERPRITLSSPTCSRMRAAASSIISPASWCFTLADITHKTLQHAHTTAGVSHFRVELYAGEAFFFVGHNGEQAALKCWRRSRDRTVAVTLSPAHRTSSSGFAVGGQESSIPRTSALSVNTFTTCASKFTLIRTFYMTAKAASPWSASRSRRQI